jgi:hypothetical protein
METIEIEVHPKKGTRKLETPDYRNSNGNNPLSRNFTRGKDGTIMKKIKER